MKHVTLVFLRRDNQILLAMKKRGFGAGMWNGPGGKAEPGETMLDAMVRECQEEIGVTPLRPQLVGKIKFFMPDDPSFEHDCHIYTTRHWEGEPAESEEMKPQWFDITKIPYADMWPSDSLWLPHVIAGEKFQGTITTSETDVTAHDIRVAPSL